MPFRQRGKKIRVFKAVKGWQGGGVGTGLYMNIYYLKEEGSQNKLDAEIPEGLEHACRSNRVCLKSIIEPSFSSMVQWHDG